MTNFLGYIFTILTVWSVVDHELVAAAGFAVTTLACAVCLAVTHR